MGSATRLSRPRDIAIGADGTIYVANGDVAEDELGSVRVFAPGAAGDRLPLRTILGTSASLVAPAGVVVDRADTVYVIGRVDRFVGKPRVTVYAPGANGHATPVRILEGRATALENPRSVALDNEGRLYVSDLRQAEGGHAYGAERGAIRVYRSGAGGNEAPVRTIMGSYTRLSGPGAVAFDRAGNLYVPNTWGAGAGSVTVYGPADTGDLRPRRIIAGEATGLHEPSALWLDRQDTLYVVNQRSVTVYPPGATGDARPVRTVGLPGN